MYLFKKEVYVSPPPEEMTPERAQEVYALCATRQSQTEIFKTGLATYAELAIVWIEMGVVEAEILSKMSGTFVVTPEGAGLSDTLITAGGDSIITLNGLIWKFVVGP